MQTYDAQYENGLALPLATPTGGKTVAFSVGADKSCCFGAFISFTAAVLGRAVTVAVQFSSDVAPVSGAWYDDPNGTDVVITNTGTGFFPISVPGYVSKFRLLFTTAGGAGADDSISVVLSGLPSQGTTIS